MHYLCVTDRGINGLIEAPSEKDAPSNFVDALECLGVRRVQIGNVIDVIACPEIPEEDNE